MDFVFDAFIPIEENKYRYDLKKKKKKNSRILVEFRNVL